MVEGPATRHTIHACTDSGIGQLVWRDAFQQVEPVRLAALATRAFELRCNPEADAIDGMFKNRLGSLLVRQLGALLPFNARSKPRWIISFSASAWLLKSRCLKSFNTLVSFPIRHQDNNNRDSLSSVITVDNGDNHKNIVVTHSGRHKILFNSHNWIQVYKALQGLQPLMPQLL